ncbi:MAG: flagellar hook-basal body complex protein [Lachnospiraceae bacterium]|nr:flagellar hook-basal body complex protein [Lachnospiraceae bacterium]
MMRSLFSGVAGLRTHQTRMDVIGNNIANVNSTSYKSSSMNFSDMLYQTTQAATGASTTTNRAGTNPKQIGLGSQTASITTSMNAGSPESTNNPYDLYITGDSFFIVSANGDSSYLYTRDGSFTIDEEGTFCMSANGYPVMGYGTTTDTSGATVIDTSSLKTMPIMSADNKTSAPSATTKAYMTGIIDSEDTDFDTTTGKTVQLSFYDNEGYEYTATFAITQDTSTSPYSYTVALSSIVDSSGTAVTSTYSFDNVTLAFNSSGTLDTTTGTLTFTSPVSTNEQTITVDFSALTNYANNGNSTVTATSGTSSSDTTGSGWATGTMSGISIGTDGTITGNYTNGQTKLLGKIPTASFANVYGLEKQGDNLYAASQNTGAITVADVTSAGGKMTTGQLEMSNVDLAAEFTRMITTQRGFQANSRIITVSDTLLEELTNLKR